MNPPADWRSWIREVYLPSGLSWCAILLCATSALAFVTEIPGSGWDYPNPQPRRITWSIAGIADWQIEDVTPSSPYKVTLTKYYVAPINPGSLAVSAHTTTELLGTNNFSAFERRLLIDIPYGNVAVWRSAVSWNRYDAAPRPEEMSFTHDSPYEPGLSQNVITIRYWAVDLYGSGGSVATFDFMVVVMSPEVYALGPGRWRWGPPHPPRYPPYWYRKPQGCNGCSPMGLPGLEVSPSQLNLVIQDTEFAYEALGPDLRFTRTYNGNPSLGGMFGNGWSFSYEAKLDVTFAGAVLHRGTGQTVEFPVPRSALPPGYYDHASGTILVGNMAAKGLPSSFTYTNWDGVYDPPEGEAMRLSVTNLNGTWSYRLRDLNSGLTYTYLTATQLATGIPLALIADNNSNMVRLLHAGGRLEAVVDAAGRTNRFAYDAAGRCTNFLSAAGTRASYRYDAAGNLIESRDLVGNTTAYTYNPQRYLTSLSTEGRTWTVTWETNLFTRVSSITDPLNHTTLYNLADPRFASRLATRVEPLGYASSIRSRNGLIEFVATPLGNTERVGWTNGLLSTRQDAAGYQQTFVYDAAHRLIRRTDASSGTWDILYDGDGRVLSVTNPASRVWSYRYDARGNPAGFTTPGGRRWELDYDPAGQLKTLTDPLGHAWRLAHDHFGNVTQAVDALGFKTSLTYDAAGIHPVSLTDARGFTTTYTFDANRRLTSVTHPDGSSIRTGYDCCAEISQVDERGRTNRALRNALLAVTQYVDRAGAVYRYDYDANRNLVLAVDAQGRTNRMAYDADNRLVAITNGLGTVIQAARDSRGYPWSITVGSNTLCIMQWDGMGNLQYFQPATWYPITFNYDVMNRLYGWQNGRGQFIRHEYDDDGHLLSRRLDGVTDATYSYDACGRLVSMTDAWGRSEFTRDARGQVTRVLYPDGLAAQMQYDPNGRLSSLSYPGGLAITYQRDSRNRVTNLVCSGFSMVFTYDASGYLVRERASTGAEAGYDRDAEGRITNLLHSVGSSNLLRLRYQRDRYGTVTNLSKVSGLIPWAPTLAAGSTTARYDAGNILTNWNGTAAGRDGDGNVTSLAGAVNLTATYTPDNRLASAIRDGTNITCVYDGAGRRVRVTRNGVTENHHLDPMGRLLFTTDAAGNLRQVFLYCDTRLVAMWLPGKGFHVYHYDAQGSTLALTDGTGRLSALYRYTPYGVPAGHFSRVPNPFTYLGRHGVMDEGDGLYFMKWRCYHARVARFLQLDPILFRGGLNLYAYAEGNPVRYADPEGLKPFPSQSQIDQFFNNNGMNPNPGVAGECKVVGVENLWELEQPGLREAMERFLWYLPTQFIPGYGVQEKLRDRDASWLDVGWELAKDLSGPPGTALDVVEDTVDYLNTNPPVGFGGDGGLEPPPSGDDFEQY